ncbi:Sulfotransferase 1 family member D1 [Lucilia cuprina]|nr:Sulfotransferase 1 family member D1 [Lucilia cuprina]
MLRLGVTLIAILRQCRDQYFNFGIAVKMDVLWWKFWCGKLLDAGVCLIIYVARNAKDGQYDPPSTLLNTLSYWWRGDNFHDYVDAFLNNEINLITHFWSHITGACPERPQLSEQRNGRTFTNIYRLIDEKNKENQFLTITLGDDNPAVKKNFMGSFKDELTPELIAKIDKWSGEFLAQHGLKEEDIFASKARMPFLMKRYATEGKNIPLKKNWSETWCTLSAHFETVCDQFFNLELRKDDVFVVTFMKSGTTWMQECAWMLLNNLDYEKSKEEVVMIRSPYMDFHSIAPGLPNHLELIEKLPSPRLIKSHLPPHLLPLQVWEKKQKIIYVARNVKDVIVSSFHFVKNLGMWRGDNFNDYVDDFLNNEIIYTHYWSHVVDFWKMRDESFIFFVTYEEMKRDLANVLQRLCVFLERPQLSEKEMEGLLEHLSFDSMKNNKKTNLTDLLRKDSSSAKEEFQFMRRGIVGSFKDELTPELIAKIDKWSDLKSETLLNNMVAAENILRSVEHVSEASKARIPFPMKRYATEGKNIPLKKNWSETWCTLSAHFETVCDQYFNLELRKDDVFVVTFMKCGTTWMQECAWLLLNNLDYEKSKEEVVMIRSPFLDFHSIMPGLLNHVELIEKLPSPRLIKSHLPANLLPLQVWEKKQKIIYVARNAKDVIVSSFHFVKNLDMWRGDNFHDYVDDFLNNEIIYTHFWSHIVDFWKMRDESFIFFVTYEEMKRDLANVLQRLCLFLERPQLSEKEMEGLLQHLSFDSMKKNKKTNLTDLLRDDNPAVKEEFQFMRRGIVGSFKDELTPELIAKIDKWSCEFLAQHGLKEEDIFETLSNKMVATADLLKTIEHVSEASKTRLRPMKKYATEGKNIPLKKNWSETWCTLSTHFETVCDQYLNLELRKDDVFVVTFMKCGTTWMQECAWLLLNDLDYEKSKEEVVMIRSPFLDFHSITPGLRNHVELIEKLPSPRLIKSHLPANLLPLQIWEKKQKIIYVARNVKDVIVSCYHFVKNLQMWQGDNFHEFVEDFLNNDIIYTHFWSHIVDFWKMRNESFIFFVTYEEMKRDLPKVLQRLCVFLERPQLSEKEMEGLLEHLSFDSMRNNKKTNLTYLLKDGNPAVKEEFQFMRRGIVGSMVHQNILKSLEHKSEATKARLPYPVKIYSTEGKNIPLKKNWSQTWCTLPAHFDKVFDEILNFELRKDDVFVVTFMKCGTTWMQECAWLLLNNLDFEKSKEAAVMIRSPFIDFHGIVPGTASPIEMCKKLSSPRLIKTHMPANLVPLQIWEKKQKMIYVARNVKDVIVSSFHFVKNLDMWRGDNFHDYVDDFLNNEIIYTHFWAHIVDFWKMRNESFIFFVTYEEMKRDLAGVLQRLCTFLERPQLTTEELEKTIKHLSFGNMKENKQTNLTYLLKDNMPGVKQDFQFMRRGIVGSFKDELTPELIAKIDKWTADFLGQYGLKEEDIFGQL